jgi:hypothetical protein
MLNEGRRKKEEGRRRFISEDTRPQLKMDHLIKSGIKKNSEDKSPES